MGKPSILHRRGEDEGMEWCRGSQGTCRKEEGKNGQKEDSQERNLLQGVLQLCITVSYLKMFGCKNLTLTIHQAGF